MQVQQQQQQEKLILDKQIFQMCSTHSSNPLVMYSEKENALYCAFCMFENANDIKSLVKTMDFCDRVVLQLEELLQTVGELKKQEQQRISRNNLAAEIYNNY